MRVFCLSFSWDPTNKTIVAKVKHEFIYAVHVRKLYEKSFCDLQPTLETIKEFKLKVGKERISLEVFVVGLWFFLSYFTITLISWKEKMKELFIANLTRGALFKETSWRFWKVSTEVWGTPGVWLIHENFIEAVELSGQKKGHIKNKLHFHLQDEQGYECVFYKLVC